MYKIDGNKITLTRGDSFYAEVGMKNGDTPYVPVQGDKIRFALKHDKLNTQKTDYVDSEPLIIKIIPNDTLLLHLEPADTKSLGFGQYVYDVEIEYANGDVDTFIQAAPFVLAKEVF